MHVPLFVYLTDQNGDPIMVSVGSILTIEKGDEGETLVCTSSGDKITVKEGIHDIRRKLYTLTY